MSSICAELRRVPVTREESFEYVDSFLTKAEKERQHQEDLQRLRGLRLIDDDFMNVYNDGAELLLRIILNKPDIKEWQPCARLWKI
jgi:hypothetical protein